MHVLVTGGAGYVGGVSVERLLEKGHRVTVLDSLVTGHRDAVPPGAEFIEGSSGAGDQVGPLLARLRPDAVLHCAARSLVAQSMADPALYYQENVVGGVALLDGMRAAGVQRLVLSSTAAVYGNPGRVPIEETDPTRPINPYGATKLALEGAMQAYSAYGLRSIALRYFNVAGASARSGERHQPETHLVPNVLAAARSGAQVTLFGSDYPTPDGTPIRDYVHVLDLADAHLAALERTESLPPGLEVINLGSGRGFSVKEVLVAAEAVVGRPIPHAFGPRRAGDPPVLVASNRLAAERLGWAPVRGSLEEMIGSAWHLEGEGDGHAG
jgi:UDP-glucose 4-epimerase